MSQPVELNIDRLPIKILLVEDDHDAARIIEGLISAEGEAFEFEWIDQLLEALKRVAQGGIDLILLDLTLPDSQNLDTLISMQQQSSSIPIIVLTGSNDELLALRAVQLGAQDYLFKGQFNRQLLVRALRYAIERKRAESALRDSENRFRALIEKSWDGVILLNSDGFVTYASPAITRIVGYVINEYVGSNAFAYLHPEDRNSVLRTFVKLMAQDGLNVTVQYRYQHKNGQWRWIECTATNLLSVSSIQAIVCNYRDISENKEAEHALRKSEERFRALIENSWDGLLLISPAGEMLYASPSTHRILGHVGDELITQNAFALMHPGDLPAIASQFQLLLKRPDETMTAEFRYQHKNGSWRWLECTATNLLINPSVGSMVINYRDITDRKMNEAALRQAHDELEERVRERTAELETLSHRLVEVQEQERRAIARELHDEVGQILTGLKINLELIKRRPAEVVDEGITRAQQQVNELLTLVRNLSLDMRPAMLDDLGLLPALLWHFDRYTAQTDVQVNFKHLNIEGRYLTEVETAVYRIVQEALTNAARHSRSKEITVLLWSSPEIIGVQIEDQGVGFEPQSVVMAGRSGGLTGMRERASLLGGRLTIESSPGSGTCVTAELPLIMLSLQTRDRALI